MIVLGLILLVLNYFMPMQVLFIAGLVLLVVGGVLLVLSACGVAIGSHHWF